MFRPFRQVAAPGAKSAVSDGNLSSFKTVDKTQFIYNVQKVKRVSEWINNSQFMSL